MGRNKRESATITRSFRCKQVKNGTIQVVCEMRLRCQKGQTVIGDGESIGETSFAQKRQTLLRVRAPYADPSLIIRAVLGRRVRQLWETYTSRGVRFYAPDDAYADAERYALKSF
jgi:hypothetical protein